MRRRFFGFGYRFVKVDNVDSVTLHEDIVAIVPDSIFFLGGRNELRFREVGQILILPCLCFDFLVVYILF